MHDSKILLLETIVDWYSLNNAVHITPYDGDRLQKMAGVKK